MKKFILAFLVLSLTAVCLYAQKNKFRTSQKPISGRYIVVLDNAAAGAVGENSRAAELSNVLSAVYGGKVDSVFRHALNGYSVEMTAAQAQKLSLDPRVKFVEEDGVAS